MSNAYRCPIRKVMQRRISCMPLNDNHNTISHREECLSTGIDGDPMFRVESAHVMNSIKDFRVDMNIRQLYPRELVPAVSIESVSEKWQGRCELRRNREWRMEFVEGSMDEGVMIGGSEKASSSSSE